MALQDYSYVGFGRVFASEVGTPTNAFEIGNCSALNLQASEDKKSLKNFKSGGGGLQNSIIRIDTVSLNMTLHDINDDNLAMMLFGDKSAAVSGSVTGESVTGYVGGLIRLANIDPSSVVVTDDPVVTTYVEGIDYEVTAAGVVPLAGGAITDGDALLIDYDYSAVSVVQALTQSAKEWAITFSGLNEARTGKAVVLDVYRNKFGPFSDLPLIGEDYAAPQLTGEVLVDSTKTGAGISQYFKVSYVD